MIYTVSFDVEVESREDLRGGWFEIHDPPPTGQAAGGYRVTFGGTQEQRDRKPRILAKRVRRKRVSNTGTSHEA